MVSRSKASERRRGRRLAVDRSAAPVPLVLDADRYGGKWIATYRGHVVAFSDDVSEVDARVTELGIRDGVILSLVPMAGDLVL